MFVFRKAGEAHALSIAMTGVRLGDRLLQIGCATPALLGAISSKVGLSGRTCVVVTSDAMATRAKRGAERAGVLVEVERRGLDKLLFDDASFDLVVVDSTDGMLGALDSSERRAALGEARRVLAPRGRIVVIEPGASSGVASLFRRVPDNAAYRASGGSPAALTDAGFRAGRTLAERDGLRFVEGAK